MLELVAAAASTLALLDMAGPFVNGSRALRMALWCWSADERGPDQDRNGVPVTPCVQEVSA